MSIATRSGMHKQGAATVDTTGHTSHHRMEVVADSASQLVARFGLWSWMTQALAADTDALLIDCELVLDDGTIVPLEFESGPTLSVTHDGASRPHFDAAADPAVTVARGDLVAVRSFCRAATNTTTVGVSWYSDTGTFSWYQAGNHLGENPASPPAMPGPAYSNTYYCHPIALLGMQA